MAESQPTTKCSHCGYPIDSGEHASNCPNNPNNKEVSDDILDSVENVETSQESKEQPEAVTKKSEVEEFAEQIENDEALSIEIIGIIDELNTVASEDLIVPEADEVIFETLPPQEDIRKQITGMKDRSELLLKEVEQIGNNIYDYEKLRDEKSKNLEELKNIANMAKESAVSVRSKINEIKRLAVDAKNIWQKYQSAVLEKSEFSNFEGIEQTRDQAYDDEYKLNSKILGGIRYRGKIRELQQHKQELDDLSSLKYNYDLGDIERSSEGTDWPEKSLKQGSASLIRKVAERVIKRFQSEISSGYKSRIDIESDGEDKIEYLDKKTTDSLQHDYAVLLLDKWQEDEVYFNEPMDNETKTRVTEIIQQAIKMNYYLNRVDDSPYFTSEEETIQNENVEQITNLLDSLPIRLRKDLKSKIRDKHGRPQKSFEEIANFFIEKYPAIEKNNIASDAFGRVLRKLDSIDEKGSMRSMVSNKREGLRIDRSNQNLFDDFVQHLDMQTWEAFLNNDQITEQVGRTELEKMDRKLLQGIMGKITNSNTGSDDRVNLAFKMMEYKTPASMQLFVINSFMEPGHQNSYPFLDRSGYFDLSNQSQLYKYADKLTDEQLKQLADSDMEEVITIIRLIKENPDTFNDPKLYKDDDRYEEIGDNPVYGQIRENLLEVGLKYLKEMPEMQSYVLRILKEVKSDLGPEAYQEIEKMIKNPFNDDVERSLPSFMLSKIGQGDARILKMWMDNPLQISKNENYQMDPILSMASEDKNIPGLLDTLDKLDQMEGGGDIYRRRYTDYYMGDAVRSSAPKEEEISILPEELDKFDENLRYLSEQGETEAFNSMALKYIIKHPELANRVVALAKKHILSSGIHETKYACLRNLEGLITDDQAYESTLKYLDASITPPKGKWDTASYNYDMLGEEALKFIAEHTDKVDSILELEKLGLFESNIGTGASEIFKNADTLLLDEDNFGKLKNYVTSVKGKNETDQVFYLDFRVIEYIGDHAETMDDILRLGDIASFDNGSFRIFMIENLDKILSIPKEKREAYITVFKNIDSSPSQEIQRLKNQLLEQLLETEDPVKAYEAIESIFIKNNLPTVGKVYKVFSELYPSEKLDRMLTNQSLSPFLRKAGNRRRSYTIYKDLLRAHIDSGNWSLKEYLSVIQSGEKAMEIIEEKGVDNLDLKEQEQAKFFLNKLNTLFDSSQLGRTTEKKEISGDADINEQYQVIRESLSVREEQSVNDRIAEMFLKPLGYDSIESVLTRMQEVKQDAHERGLRIVGEARDKKINIEAGDLLKGVDHKYFANIMQNGSVAKEYLGASAGSDQTPLDTDLSKVLEKDLNDGNESAVSSSIASNFGELIFVVKNRGQYQETTDENIDQTDPAKLELFNSGSDRHFGIRTGFPSTEIDYMLVHRDLESNRRELNKIFFEIAKNGHYIPMVDNQGNIIFTPEQYKEIRETFEGVEKFDGPELDIVPMVKDNIHAKDVDKLTKKLRQDKEKVVEHSSTIREAVSDVLRGFGIELKSEFDTGLLGAELYDTGSTGRHTNTPGAYDFDFTLKLDDDELSKAQSIIDELKSRFKAEKVEEYGKEAGHYQLRAFGAKGITEEPVDIDIGIVKKSELAVFGSHDAVSAKLYWIKENLGEEIHEQTLANIVLAKQVLKKGKAYKKIEHGGMGGIGVENWVLLQGGNMLEAFRTFQGAAYKDGERLTLSEFKDKYKVLDAGVNVQKLTHDNYIEKLTEQGYSAMLDIINRYLAKQ